MHPLRVLLFVSLGIAAAIAVAFWSLLMRASAARAIPAVLEDEAVLIAAAVFAAFLVPWLGVFAWAVRRASDLDLLTDRARFIAEGHYEELVGERVYHGELDDLGRAIEELRSMLVREKESFNEQRATMNQIVASLGEGLLGLSPRGRVVFANERVLELFGNRGPIVGKSFLEVVRSGALASAFDRALRGESSAGRTAIGSDGSERQIEIRVFPVAASTEIAAVALFIDMTQIEQLQRIRKAFLDDFSHEVRTPLAGLRSAAESFEEGELTREQEDQLRKIMLRQLTRIERLVKDLSELNRIESGELVLQRRTVDLYELIADLCDEFRKQLAEVDIRVTLRGQPTIGCVDPDRAQQIFANLLDNAVKHGGGRGEILVEVSQENGEAVVRVSDEGEGIPPQETERIFNRFYRVDKSRSQNIPGVGLGLAIAKHLVLLHLGAIRAYNRPTRGATFEVRLPEQ